MSQSRRTPEPVIQQESWDEDDYEWEQPQLTSAASAPAGWNQYEEERREMGEATVQDRYSEPGMPEPYKEEYVDGVRLRSRWRCLGR